MKAASISVAELAAAASAMAIMVLMSSFGDVILLNGYY